MAKINSTRRNKAFDLPTAPSNRLEGNRWLSYATFGAATARTNISASTRTSIVPIAGEVDDAVRLASIGYEAYINEQIVDNSIVSLFKGEAANGIIGGFGEQTFGNIQAGMHAWFSATALHGSAQIRLKLAYALSQIFVINGKIVARNDVRQYIDLLVKASLSTNTSSFRTLLDDVTYSIAMSNMLTYRGNKKADATTNSRPDENYAREILQLFTIGLKQLNIDGTPMLDANGNEMETYAPSDIPEVAKVFTGLDSSGSDTPGLTEYNFVNNHNQLAVDLFAYPNASRVTIPAITGTQYKNVDAPPKASGYVIRNVDANTFVIDITRPEGENRSGINIQYTTNPDLVTGLVAATTVRVDEAMSMTITKVGHNLTNGQTVYIYSNAQRSIKTMLDYIFNHPNVGPFIAKNLIKFFVTSNPTPDYVKRVALKFNNNGNGVRGDLSAVVKAILLDREAILPYGINPNNHGRYTTLVDRVFRVGRAFRSDMIHGNLENHAAENRNHDFGVTTSYFSKPRNINDYHACAVLNTNQIMAFESASVFNFFRPGYTPPGTLIGSLGKTAPEMQINTVDSQIRWVNAITSLCETEISGVSSSAQLDPAGNGREAYGFDFAPDPAGFTVATITPTITVTGNVTSNMTSGGRWVYFKAKKEGSTRVFDIQHFRDNGSGTKTIQIHTGETLAVGEKLFFSPLAVYGMSGFPTRFRVDGGGNGGPTNLHPMLVLFHKVAAFFDDTITTPTTAQLDSAINYLESILMTRPISEAGKGLMRQAGSLATTADTVSVSGDAAFNNNYLYVNMGHAQKRARRMTGIVLALPEFSVQR